MNGTNNIVLARHILQLTKCAIVSEQLFQAEL